MLYTIKNGTGGHRHDSGGDIRKASGGTGKGSKKLVQQALDEGFFVNEILEKGLLAGMNVIGEKFRNNEIFVPEVLVAARAMNMGADIYTPDAASAAFAAVERIQKS